MVDGENLAHGRAHCEGSCKGRTGTVREDGLQKLNWSKKKENRSSRREVQLHEHLLCVWPGKSVSSHSTPRLFGRTISAEGKGTTFEGCLLTMVEANRPKEF